MPDTTLDLVRAAASHPLLGEGALIDSTASTGTTTTLTDTSLLLTTANDQTYRNRWLYFWSGVNAGVAGQERFVSAVTGDTGVLTWINPLTGAITGGDGYLLFRDHRWSDWLRFANETARNLYSDREIYLRGQTDLLRYTLPTPLSQPGWIEAAFIGEFPFAFSTDFSLPRKIDWFRLDPLNIQGDIYLVLTASIGADRQILFKARVPYLHPHLSAYTMTRSVLTPFGETQAISIPRNLLVAGMVWRSLQQKVPTLTGAAQQLWQHNLDRAARFYAEELRGIGVWAAGREVGYANRW